MNVSTPENTIDKSWIYAHQKMALIIAEYTQKASFIIAEYTQKAPLIIDEYIHTKKHYW